MKYPDISKRTGKDLWFQIAIVIGLDVAAIPVPAVAQQAEDPSPGEAWRNVDVTPEQWFTFSAICDGKSQQDIERILGIPQAYIPSAGLALSVVYFGPVPDTDTWVPIILGPIEITYSQYNTVMGKRYYGDRPRNKDRSSGEPSGESVETIIEGKWSSMFARIQENMARDDVEEILGQAQAYDQLLVAPYATGPSIPHQEAFYGPLTVADTHQPLLLGSITVFFRANHTVATTLYRWQYQGIEKQAWPVGVPGPTDIPIEEGWAARFKRVKIGMTEAEVQRLLGPPTEHPLPGIHGVSYGPHPRPGIQSASLILGPKITIEYSSDGAVTGKRYNCDWSGYESEMGWPAQELHPGP